MNRIVGVSEIEPAELRASLETGHPPFVIDIRDPERYRAGHIAGAVSLQPDQIDGFLTRRGPGRDRVIVVVCYHGNSSLLGAARARAHGYLDVRSLRGGMAGWSEAGLPSERGASEPLDSALLRPPVLALSRFEQTALVVAAFGFKPTYMLLSLALILWLWPRRERGLDLARYGLVAFLAGEWLCAANFSTASGSSELLEVGHQLGMVVGSALIPWGFFVLFDERVLRFTDATAPCVAVRLCKECWKRAPVSCGMHRVMLLAAPVLALVALAPLCVGVRPIDVTVPIFGTDVSYRTAFGVLLPELRAYPVGACAALAVTAVLLWRGRHGLRAAERTFFIGIGFLIFSLFRFTLIEAYRTAPVWMDFWEETTELASIVGVGVFLLAFRRQLGLWWPRRREPPRSEEPA
jgi:rhodanese-related sulfurtransferase